MNATSEPTTALKLSSLSSLHHVRKRSRQAAGKRRKAEIALRVIDDDALPMRPLRSCGLSKTMRIAWSDSGRSCDPAPLSSPPRCMRRAEESRSRSAATRHDAALNVVSSFACSLPLSRMSAYALETSQTRRRERESGACSSAQLDAQNEALRMETEEKHRSIARRAAAKADDFCSTSRAARRSLAASESRSSPLAPKGASAATARAASFVSSAFSERSVMKCEEAASLASFVIAAADASSALLIANQLPLPPAQSAVARSPRAVASGRWTARGTRTKVRRAPSRAAASRALWPSWPLALSPKLMTFVRPLSSSRTRTSVW